MFTFSKASLVGLFLIVANLSYINSLAITNKSLKQLTILFNTYNKCKQLNNERFYNCIKKDFVLTLNDVSKYRGDIKIVSDYLVLVDDSSRDGNDTSIFHTMREKSIVQRDEPMVKNTQSTAAQNMNGQDSTQVDSLKPIVGNNQAAKVPFGTKYGKVFDDLEHKNQTFESDVRENETEVTSGDDVEIEDVDNTVDADLQANEPRHGRELFSQESLRTKRKNDAGLNQMLTQALQRIMHNRSLLLKLPLNNLQYLQVQDDADEASELEQGRKKKDNHGMLMACLMMGGTVLSLAFGSLAVLAGKALMTSMLALMMSLLSSMKKGGGHSSGYTAGTTYEVINVPSVGGRDYKPRRINEVVQHIAEGDFPGWSPRGSST